MGVNFLSAKIVKIVDLTGDVKEFSFKIDGEIDFKAGQFMSIKIDDGVQPFCMRSYSVLKGEDGIVQIVVKKVDGGRGTSFLFSRSVGDEVSILFPLGKFGLPSKISDKLLFVGTGTGIAPLLAMVEELVDFSGEVRFLFGVRYVSDFFYVDRLNKLKDVISNFDVKFVYSRESDDKVDYAVLGHVTDFLGDDLSEWQVFVCGNGGMVQDTVRLSKEKGCLEENVFFEDFG